MDMIGKELKIIKLGKVYGVSLGKFEKKILIFVGRRPKTLQVKKFALNMDQNSTLDVSKKLFRKQNRNWKLISNEN